MSLPMHGVRETRVEPEPPDATGGLEASLRAAEAEGRARGEAMLRESVAGHPQFLAGWAQLSDWARESGDPVAAYAFARTGYHRGLDRIRRAGWGGQGPVPWSHEPNRGFLRACFALLQAARAIGEEAEVARLRDFLLELDPDDAQGVRDLPVGGDPVMGR